MKKFILISLSLALIFVLSACVSRLYEKVAEVPSSKELPTSPVVSDDPEATVPFSTPNEPTAFASPHVITPDPDVVTAVKIVDTSKGLDIAFATAIEEVYEDSRAVYCFSCIKSHYIMVYFTDGSEMNIKDALNSGLLTIDEAKALGVRFIEESKNLVER